MTWVARRRDAQGYYDVRTAPPKAAGTLLGWVTFDRSYEVPWSAHCKVGCQIRLAGSSRADAGEELVQHFLVEHR